MTKKALIALSVSSLFFTGCSELAIEKVKVANTDVNQAEQTTKIIDNNELSASAQANQLFDQIYMASVERNPVTQTYLGIKTDYDKWNDYSEQNSARELAIAKADLAKIMALDSTQLDNQTLISYQLYVQRIENNIADYQWRFHNYPVNQMFGTHSQIPAFMINQHSISNVKEAKDYISRIQASEKLLNQLVVQLKLREQRGIIAPTFVFEHVIRDSNNILVGVPFDSTKDSTLLADFKQKISKLEISNKEKSVLVKLLKQALIDHLKPGYITLVNYLNELVLKSNSEAGAWSLPQGDAFFTNALNRTTTTDLSADEIHDIGLKEVTRIHQEMRGIMSIVGFDGDLAAFFNFMRHDKQFYYDANEQGRARYLKEAVALIDDMEGRLDSLFLTKPKAKLKVKAVEAFREKSAGKAFYQQPAPDGSRPGVYYANLYDMQSMPTYQMAALAYHEGIPGHHMQIAIKQELTNIPKFRKFGGYTAHTEGWGLYSEMIPKEIGLYQDPYSDFGRLAMELWRACRLVVDTGIHSKKWTRGQGIEYYINNTPNAKSDAVKMVERHIVMPSQATAYKIGMLKIIELRERAKIALAEKFDIREFHDVVLRNGPVPLNVLSKLVDDYIKKSS